MLPHLCAYPNPGIRFLSVVALALNYVYVFFTQLDESLVFSLLQILLTCII